MTFETMPRKDVVKICDEQVLDRAARLFGTRKEVLTVFADYEGAANLVYAYEREDQPMILRVSFRPDRSREQIRAELHFVNALAEGGVRVSRPVPSLAGRLIETIETSGIVFHVVSFVKGRGMRVPDNGYRYRSDAPIEEYFQNWGRVLGQMHRLAKAYRPPGGRVERPTWWELHQDRLAIEARVPERLSVVRERIRSLLRELETLPRDRDGYGLIHGDFNDGNFTVDYSNGNMTVFDFDDCCHFWFVYELAAAWEGGIGRIMFRGLDERKAFMDRYMDQVMAGYTRENVLDDAWLARLPLFVKLIQVEMFLHYVQYVDDPDDALQGELDYMMTCIREDIPFMGFFDSLYSPEKPFSL